MKCSSQGNLQLDKKVGRDFILSTANSQLIRHLEIIFLFLITGSWVPYLKAEDIYVTSYSSYFKMRNCTHLHTFIFVCFYETPNGETLHI